MKARPYGGKLRSAVRRTRRNGSASTGQSICDGGYSSGPSRPRPAALMLADDAALEIEAGFSMPCSAITPSRYSSNCHRIASQFSNAQPRRGECQSPG